MTRGVEGAFATQAREREALATALVDIPGGLDLLEWFGGVMDFGDSEIVRIVLDRQGPSQLVIALDWPQKTAVVTFELSAWIDLNLRGFNHQNVIGGLALKRTDCRSVDPWEQGAGLQPGEWDSLGDISAACIVNFQTESLQPTLCGAGAIAFHVLDFRKLRPLFGACIHSRNSGLE